MVYPKIRLQNHGKKNHKYWWIVIQSSNKCFKGRILEKVGYWIPRKTKTIDRSIVFNKHRLNYWLAVGAQPTHGVHRLLSIINVLPKKPIPFGSKSLYPKPEKTYKLDFYHKHRWSLEPNKLDSQNTFYLQKIEEMKQIYERKNLLDKEALNEMTGRSRLLQNNKTNEKFETDVDTDKLDSDDHDFYCRKRNFEIITKKFSKHLESKYKLYRGNDLQYNNYVRKMEKLATGMSLDVSGFKDFMININKMKDSQFEMAKKLASNFFKEYQERELRREENTRFSTSKEPNSFINSSLNETKILLDALERGINSDFKRVFDVSDEDLQRKEFLDLRTLRIAKFIKKIRMSLISLSIMQHFGSDEKTKSTFDELYEKIDKEIEFSDVPYLQGDMFNAVLNSRSSEYHDQLFASISKYIASSDTIKKYKNMLLDEETINNLEKEEAKGSIAKNESYLLYNDESLEYAISHGLYILSKNYHLNDIYRDKEKMEELEKKEKERYARKANLRSKIKNLKEKIFNELIFEESHNEKSGKSETIQQLTNDNLEVTSDKKKKDEENTSVNLGSSEDKVLDLKFEDQNGSSKRKIDKSIKFLDKSRIYIELKKTEKELEMEDEKKEYLDKNFKVIEKIDLVHPDKKPTNKKLSEMDIAEENRKYKYLEDEKALQKKYANYDPSDKLHNYFDKKLKENKNLITDKRERIEIEKYINSNYPVREYYDNLALYYEEIENAKIEADIINELNKNFNDFGRNSLKDISPNNNQDPKFYQDINKDLDDSPPVLADEEEEEIKFSQGIDIDNRQFIPVIKELELYELSKEFQGITSADFNSNEFNEAVKKAIIQFESRKPIFQSYDDLIAYENFHGYYENSSYLKDKAEFIAENKRREHIDRIKSKFKKTEKIKLVEDKPFPRQINKRDQRSKYYFIDGKKILRIPPPRRSKDDPIRLKEKRKPRDVVKENARLMSNVIRQNIKNTTISNEKALIIKERYHQYFGHPRLLMYPDGFRHLENYNTFKVVFPEKTMNDYQLELYSMCDFDTFIQVIYGHFEQFKKLGLLAFEFEELVHFMPFYVNYLKSKHSMFIPIIKESYRDILREFQANDRNFTVLEAVELVSEFNNNILSMPKIKDIFTSSDMQNHMNNDQSYIPTKYTTVPFPDLKGDQGDESGLNRTSPFFPINPLKGHPIKQSATFNDRKIFQHTRKFYPKGMKFHTNGRHINQEEYSENSSNISLFLNFPNIYPNLKTNKNLFWRFENDDLKI